MRKDLDGSLLKVVCITALMIGSDCSPALTDAVVMEKDYMDRLEGNDERSEPTIWGIRQDHPLLTKRFLNIAHRGGGRLAPEETMAAYNNAVAIGVDMLEMDLHATRDGVVVLIHDDTVDRTTNGTGKVKDMTFEELQSLDAGYAFSPDDGLTHPFRGKGIEVSSFREVMQKFPEMFFSVEIKQVKPSIVDAVLAVLDETQMSDRVILVSFHDDVVKDIREKRPDIVTGAGTVEMAEFYLTGATGKVDYEPPCPYFQIPQVDQKLMQLAQSVGAKVQVWTINDETEMRTLLDLGVDGIMTDDPALLAEIIAGHGTIYSETSRSVTPASSDSRPNK